MGKKDKRVDTIISKSQPFAQPILKHIRKVVHDACPDVEENIKWGMPAFEYHGLMISMAAFKQHAAMVFHKHKLMKDPKNVLGERASQGGEAMGNLGRITSIKDLPSEKILKGFIQQAMKINQEGLKMPVDKKKNATALPLPDYFQKALKKKNKALTHFDKFSPSGKNEYINWLTEAKTEATRNKRLAEAIEWISEGKPRMWKYMNKKK